MYNLSNIFNVTVKLHKLADGKPNVTYFNAANIFRYSAHFSDATIDEKRAEGKTACSTLHYTSTSGHAYECNVLETPEEIKTAIEAAKLQILEQIKAARLPLNLLPLKPIVILTRKNDVGPLQDHFDANAIYRFEEKASGDALLEKREKGQYCTSIGYHHAKGTEVLETADEIAQKILDTHQNILKRVQNISLCIQ